MLNQSRTSARLSLKELLLAERARTDRLALERSRERGKVRSRQINPAPPASVRATPGQS